MSRLQDKSQNKLRRKSRIRRVVEGTSERPRLSVFVSLRHVHAQVIDDSKQKTLFSVTTEALGSKDEVKTMSDKAKWAGHEISKKAKSAKVKKVAFDRNGRAYHGKIKALAEAAREGGLEF